MSERISFAQAMLAASVTALGYWLATAVFRTSTEPNVGFAPFWQQALVSVVLILPIAVANALAWAIAHAGVGVARGVMFNGIVGTLATVLMVLMFQGWMGAWGGRTYAGTLLTTILAAVINLGAIFAIAQIGVQPR